MFLCVDLLVLKAKNYVNQREPFLQIQLKRKIFILHSRISLCCGKFLRGIVWEVTGETIVAPARHNRPTTLWGLERGFKQRSCLSISCWWIGCVSIWKQNECWQALLPKKFKPICPSHFKDIDSRFTRTLLRQCCFVPLLRWYKHK